MVPMHRCRVFATVGTSETRQLWESMIFLMQLTFGKDNCREHQYVRTFVIRGVPADEIAVIFEPLVSQLQKRSIL